MFQLSGFHCRSPPAVRLRLRSTWVQLVCNKCTMGSVNAGSGHGRTYFSGPGRVKKDPSDVPVEGSPGSPVVSCH